MSTTIHPRSGPTCRDDPLATPSPPRWPLVLSRLRRSAPRRPPRPPLPPARDGRTSARCPTVPRRETHASRCPVVDRDPRRAAGAIRDSGNAGRRPRPAAGRLAAAGLHRHRPEDAHRLRARPRPAGRRACSASKPTLNNATWENLFVGIDSGRTDVGFSNITDTEQRKLKYDFASYRQDNLGFEVLASNPWTFGGDYHVLAGKTVAVGRGHQPGEDPPGVAEQAAGRGQGASTSSTSRTPTPPSSP